MDSRITCCFYENLTLCYLHICDALAKLYLPKPHTYMLYDNKTRRLQTYVLMSSIRIDFYGSRLRMVIPLCNFFMLAFLSMQCGFSHWKFHKLRWASTLNQKHLFVTTSLSTTQFEYGVKFSMEIQTFRKIIEFVLTLAVISPLFYARGRASFKHGGGVITSSLTNAV
jgi:hypothetical protein